jgi:SET domain-containing protein
MRVIEYTGKRIPLSEALRIKSPSDIYLVHISRGKLLDGRFFGSGAERINHSCDPNLIYKRARGRLVYYSRRRIRAGEELTFRYSYPINLTRIPCHCGAPNCRKVLRYIVE